MPRVREHEYGKIKQYRGFAGIKQWIIRNLMTYGNCCFKATDFVNSRIEFELLFGKKNIVIQDSDKHCIVMSINNKAKIRAAKYVLV